WTSPRRTRTGPASARPTRICSAPPSPSWSAGTRTASPSRPPPRPPSCRRPDRCCRFAAWGSQEHTIVIVEESPRESAVKHALRLAALAACLVPSLLLADPAPDPQLKPLQWRLAGPFDGGRVDAVAGIPGDKRSFYMGAADGGIWKTTDAGIHWINVSDCCLTLGTVGALAVAPS